MPAVAHAPTRHETDRTSPYFGYLYHGRTPRNRDEFADASLDPQWRAPGDVCHADPTDVETYRSVTSTTPEQPTRPEHLEIRRMVRSWAEVLGSKHPESFIDYVGAWCEAWPRVKAECDELERIDNEDEADDPRELYRVALSELGRSKHLRKIWRLSGTYPTDTGDMTTGEVYSWWMEIHDAVVKYHNAMGCRT